jgi:hypothetical protein
MRESDSYSVGQQQQAAAADRAEKAPLPALLNAAGAAIFPTAEFKDDDAIADSASDSASDSAL